MAPKQFHAPRDKRPPLEFEITYLRLKDGDWEDETEKFRARPAIAGGLMLTMSAAMDSGVAVQSAEIIRMLDGVIWPEDKARFNEVINDPDSAIPIETLAEIITWLIEEYAERPTQRP
jgi:hypothetical protein